MKRIFPAIVIWTIVLTNFSCSNVTTETVIPKVSNDTGPFEQKQFENYPMRVTDAYRIVGGDSLNLLADTIIQQYRDAVCLVFREGYVYFYGSSSIPNTKFPAHAQTFSLNIKIMLPTNMKYHWNTEKQTLIVRSSGSSSYFPIIPDGKEAYIDTTGVFFHKSMEEAQNSGKREQIRFIFNDVDPRLGAVSYHITMRPLWFYEREPFDLAHQRFVMF
ncbi:hypothetical protein LXM25_19000 [Dyadobacter sp. LJ53]|uniref:hypothetical protein n=1 Tax=Dyadobacter chenwenxiniae TaxID=2906456 RepID=UPI001F3D4A70|nr:hypothetical protein [Dyadobacter chenwenxiniae]MCF0052163.1 hypothetical protein [Dyadobacter chenwenxiniae]